MKKPHLFAVIFLTPLFILSIGHFAGKAAAGEGFPYPCGSVCEGMWFHPCDPVHPCAPACQATPSGSYLYDKSIFDSRLFENRLVGKKSKSRIQFYGWMLTGVTVNNHGATHEYGGSAYGFNNRQAKDGTTIRPGYNDHSGNTYVLQLEQPTDWKVNQLWLGARRDLESRFGWGFRADFVYGTDIRYARNWGDRSFDNNWGSGDYFAAFPQLFGTVGTKELFVKVGKFAGGFSYEGLAAPREFFYSHANICYGRPLVAQGAVVEWHPNKKWSFTGGWLAGVFNSFENPYNDSAFLGTATYNFTKDAALTYKTFYNDRGARPAILGGSTGQIDSIHTLIFTQKINQKWFYMGEVAYTNHLYDRFGATRNTGNAWGTNHHLIRTFTDKFSLGFRGEYHYSRNSTFDLRSVTWTDDMRSNGGQGGDIWTFTVAAQYKMTPKITFRPEIRYDYADYNNGFRPFGGNNSKKDQLCGGVSFLVMF